MAIENIESERKSEIMNGYNHLSKRNENKRK